MAEAFGNALGNSLAESISRPSLPASMRNLPQQQQDRMLDMAQKAGLNAWSSDDKYEIIKRAADVRFSAAGQDLAPTEIFNRTGDYLRLLGASDQQITQVGQEYAAARVLRIGHVDVNLMGPASPLQFGDFNYNDGRPSPFLGARSIDSTTIGAGELLGKFADYVDRNPIARYALEGLDIAAGPAMYVIRNSQPIQTLSNAVATKVTDAFDQGFQNAGRSALEARNGGVGGAAMLSNAAGGLVGAYKSIRTALANWRTSASPSQAAKHGIFLETGSGSSLYRPVDSLMRPTGISASITRDMIGTGTMANKRILPPGWAGNGNKHNQARGHLLGNQLGGSGDLPENLVTLQQDWVNTPVMRDFEGMVRGAAERGETVQYQVAPMYRGDNLIPRGVTMNAIGNNGFNLNVTTLNPIGK